MNPFRNVVAALGKQEWFARMGRKLVPLDVKVQEATGGRLSVSRLVGLPALLLTTTGRKTGRPRSVPLVYVPYGEDLVVTASNWGQEHHPAWSANLLANPDAEAVVHAVRHQVRARLVTGEERARVWREIVRLWPAYEVYAGRAGNREIRLFLLSKKR
ncbi:deazaflavin-dependent oxidoreductase (nitroreductase family) [Crossiella equi]|uniref:Deazaflavin-dependent oxidoreductase (Nitroreductase family) n=1 Tax=Crossiella equi TaxID=130796 RepID=A0ABS5AB72_9PSEU|nr:nitroreductase/quinone reductase family protein [Crossiella equi]MBP2472960.1 deazaflavin-dependent oxidoreductase (nitroreductase family) [Crossiella equi]